MNRLRSTPLPAVQLRAALASNLDALPDAELLDRFARYADHPAFDVLLRRHGPMVLGVCRRTLGGSADTDDAFQATFLVLLRKAKTVRGERFGPWLYGVAWRVAQKARARAARFAAHRTEGVDMLPAADDHAPVPDWLPVLDAELNALPAKYRDALVLCELQGRSRAAAARELGLREGTLSSRLARGRDLLRKRLLKHGTLLPAGGLAARFAAAEVSRATVPVSLLAAASELAKRGATGTIPAGAARLTDEVLKSMLLTKLRVTGGVLVACVLAAFGLTAAAQPHTAPEGERPKPTAAVTKAADNSSSPAQQPERKSVGAKLSDRDAFQGQWTVEKLDLGKEMKEDAAKRFRDAVGRMRFLIAGDMWWGATGGPTGHVFMQRARLDPTKNPKWLALGGQSWDRSDQTRAIYELDGDALRVCISLQGGSSRPAEFTTAPSAPYEPGLVVLHLRRDQLQPTAGEPALAGSWESKPEPMAVGPDRKIDYVVPPERIEVTGNVLFAHIQDKKSQNGWSWTGGRYTVDTTKNPKWIDVDLMAPLGDGKATKLYGCYEVNNGRLKMALGTRRATRPLEFAAADEVLLFDLGPTERDALESKGTFLDLCKGAVGTEPAAAPKPESANDWYPEAQRLIAAGEFAAAEKFVGERLPGSSGLDRAKGQMILGVCLIQLASQGAKHEAAERYRRAKDSFRAAAAEASKAPSSDKQAAWVLTQADVRTLQALLMSGQLDELLETAGPLAKKYSKTVDGLIVLSQMYNAHKQKGELTRAEETRDKMMQQFDALKHEPGAFPAGSGEYSRSYWERTWFSSK